MCDYPFFIPQVVLFANSSLFWFKVTNEHREFRNYLNTFKTVQQSAKDKEDICRRADARQRYLTQDFMLCG